MKHNISNSRICLFVGLLVTCLWGFFYFEVGLNPFSKPLDPQADEWNFVVDGDKMLRLFLFFVFYGDFQTVFM
jgi:hypothetical protein